MAYKNKKDQKLASNRHYLKNKDKIKTRSKETKVFYRKRNRDFVNLYLKTHPCLDCGISDIRVLEFDHVFGIKFKTICEMVNKGSSIGDIQLEINKCEIRCANCHRIKTRNTIWNKK